jgi:hypothetical protein
MAANSFSYSARPCSRLRSNSADFFFSWNAARLLSPYLASPPLDSSLLVLYSASSAAARAKFLGKLAAFPFATFVTLLHVGHL